MRLSGMHRVVGLARVCLALVCVATVRPAAALTPPGFGSPMVPATYQPINDSRGVGWTVAATGAISTNNAVLQNAASMAIDGLGFTSTQPAEMTPDGQDVVVTGQCGNVRVTRQIHLDSLACAARVIETLSNPGPQDLGPIEVTLQMPIRLMSGYYSDTGSASPTTLDAQATGVLAFSRIGRNTGVAWWLCSPKGRVKPFSIQGQSNRNLQVSYRVSLPRGAKVSIMHGIGEFVTSPLGTRYTNPPTDRKSLTAFMAVCDTKQWMRDLPREARHTLVNVGPHASIEQPKGRLPAGLSAVLERAGIERGLRDVLAIDADSNVEGTTRCEGLWLTCPRGHVELSLDDVALICGGAGRARPAAVYLRNGEVLVGELTAKDFVLSNLEGLKIDLVPAQMDVLAMHVSPADSRPDDEIAALATIATGERLAVRSEPKQKLTIVTAWGAAAVSWDQLQWLAYEQLPQPAFRAAFRDRSRLTVLVVGQDLELDTERWNTVKLPVRELRRWDSTKASTAAALPDDLHEADDDGLPGPYVRLTGENLLTAAPTDRELHLLTLAGERAIEPRHVEHMTRDEDGKFRCELSEGSTLVGSLQEARLTVRWRDQLFRIPTKQLITLRGVTDSDGRKSAAEN